MSLFRFLVIGLTLAGATGAPSFAQDRPPAQDRPVASDRRSDEPRFTLEQQMLLRCSAAFALAAHAQARGDPAALLYPPLEASGREFFVRASARLMDERGLDRPAIAALLAAEAREIAQGEMLDAIVPVCLPLLDAE